MNPQATIRPRIGFVSTWPIYQGTTIDRHAQALVQGISAAARDRGCDLLLGAGVSPRAERNRWRTAWPTAAAAADFVPVGPWNTDGLIIVSDDLSETQAAYARDMQAVGYPVVFTTPEGPGPRVSVDNRAGIHAAIRHLVEHGHRRIAFVAGTGHRGGDSSERLRAYREALDQAGLEADPALMAFGEHRFDGGQAAMDRILASGAKFTAFVASNDLSCLGAIDALRVAGRRVPQDVAAIGFDDILDARSNMPSLTTVRHPTFALGYQAVLTLLDCLAGRPPNPARVVVSTRLIPRQSCGCGRRGVEPDEDDLDSNGQLAVMARRMAEAAFGEARTSTLDEFQRQSSQLLDALITSLEHDDEGYLHAELGSLLARTEAHGEDAHVWQSAISALFARSAVLRDRAPDASQARFMGLLDLARLEISENVQRRTTRALLDHVDMMSQLGLLTAQLMASHDIAHTAEILTEHLPRLGIDQFLIARYAGEGEDQTAWCEVLLSSGLPDLTAGSRFAPRQFPPPDLMPDLGPRSLLVLPLVVDDGMTGFVSLPTTGLEVAAAIVGNLAMALRASRLYQEAIDGRELAEGANRLKTRFLSMVSHELRSPLSVIVGLSDMVLRESRESEVLTPNAQRDLEHLSTSAQHLGRLIGDVLDLASSEAGQLRLVRQPLDLSEVLSSACLTGELIVREKGLAWTATVPRHGALVAGDRTRLRQVVLNLIANAVKFTDHGSIDLDVATGGGWVEVSVTDTGPGIRTDEQERVFDEFYRSDQSAPGGSGGLGLGLAIARQIVQHHGGAIGVRSPVHDGRGSTFYFRLPTIVAQANVVGSSAGRQAVLLLTDQATIDPWLGRHLAERGFDVVRRIVGANDDLAEVVFEVRPEAVVLDAGLAPHRGWGLARRLLHQPGFENLPLLAYRFGPERPAGLVELNYLLKPLEAAELARVLAGEGIPGPETGVSPTILIVDDDPEVRRLHARVAQEAGGRTIEARNGSEALAIVQTDPPDLVLLDLVMPGMDGFEVLEAMRSRNDTRDIPVVVVTGQMLSDDDVDRLNRGVALLLGKGVFTPDEMIGRIETALSRRRTMADATRHLVRRATAFIESHHAEAISREAIARHVSMSPDYLTDCFRQELGITPIVYLNRCRIRAARALLDTTDRAVTDVALSVGFADISHFTRTFHREVGMSPRAYRHRDHLERDVDPGGPSHRRSSSGETPTCR
jgi:signal transduction histidine kinase/DNA-binding LacI/PurR family transcriptional regulator/CheY-like chemotaxis protein